MGCRTLVEVEVVGSQYTCRICRRFRSLKLAVRDILVLKWKRRGREVLTGVRSVSGCGVWGGVWCWGRYG
jgi:hypothetical protein